MALALPALKNKGSWSTTNFRCLTALDSKHCAMAVRCLLDPKVTPQQLSAQAALFLRRMWAERHILEAPPDVVSESRSMLRLSATISVIVFTENDASIELVAKGSYPDSYLRVGSNNQSVQSTFDWSALSKAKFWVAPECAALRSLLTTDPMAPLSQIDEEHTTITVEGGRPEIIVGSALGCFRDIDHTACFMNFECVAIQKNVLYLYSGCL